MNLAEYELFEESYDDVRFGPIKIYQNKNNHELHMVKEVAFINEEEFTNNALFYKTRKKFKNPYLWEMLDLNLQKEHLLISSRFSYPNEDVFEYRNILKRPQEMMKFLTDSLKALNVLEKNSFIHGSIRPETFFYS